MSVGIFVRLKDEQIWTRFKEFVLKKHQKLHGALGLELSKAIEYYLQSQGGGDTRTHINAKSENNNVMKNNNGNSRTLKNLKTIVSQILRESEREIGQPRVEQIITMNAGGETRTIRRYMKYLVDEYGILRPIRRAKTPDPKEIKFIFEVNVNEAKKLIGLHI